MTDCKQYHDVSMELFNCVKKSSSADHGTTYDPPEGVKGISTTDTPVGTIVLDFDLDTSTSTIQYCIKKKPFIVSAGQIFNGIADSINDCRKK